MDQKNSPTHESFDALLHWLDHDRDAAAAKYENIRRRLIRIFAGRGCCAAEELTDRTFDRVIQKMPLIADSYNGEPILYFYGVAQKIYLEWLREQKKSDRLELPVESDADREKLEIEYSCLENCLKKLSPDHYQIIIEYYSEEKTAKIIRRRELAKKLAVSVNALQAKASRIRVQLKDCVQKCLARQS